MNNQKFTTLKLLQELEQKLQKNEIGFWIEGQDCYLWQNTFHYSNKVKVGDLSQTKEQWWTNWANELEKYHQEAEIKRKIIQKQFQDISDVALVEELAERVNKKSIILSMYSNHERIFVDAKDITKGIVAPLPITIKKN